MEEEERFWIQKVVQRVDNARSTVQITIQWISVDKTYHTIHWIAIYPVIVLLYSAFEQAGLLSVLNSQCIPV